MNMYKSIKSCVMDSGIRSDFFASHVGVRQGENLSPLLFALFLNVLDTFFTKQKWDTLDYIDKLHNDCNNNVSRMLNLFVLLYADDTVIMAENECGMQRNLNLLNEYCNCNGLRVNTRNFFFLQNNGMSYIWATQDFKVDSNNVHKCECDQFKQLWHSRITCDVIDSNNMMYKTFKYSHGKEKYTEILPEHFKKALFQFRMGTHKLPVNNSKHFNVPRADRHYKYKL